MVVNIEPLREARAVPTVKINLVDMYSGEVFSAELSLNTLNKKVKDVNSKFTKYPSSMSTES